MIEISATVRVTVYPDGTVIEEDNARLSPNEERENDYRLALEDKYPTSRPPKNAKLYEVRAVISADTFLLDDGTLIKLAGVTCPDDSKHDYYPLFAKPLGISYAAVQEHAQASKHFLEVILEGEKVAFFPQSEDNDGAIRAYLWTVDVDYSMMEDPELKDFITEPVYVYTCVNETVLSSGWCLVDTGQQHSYSEKYSKLQESAKRLKCGLWE